jgi:hypothetical protein
MDQLLLKKHDLLIYLRTGKKSGLFILYCKKLHDFILGLGFYNVKKLEANENQFN